MRSTFEAREGRLFEEEDDEFLEDGELKRRERARDSGGERGLGFSADERNVDLVEVHSECATSEFKMDSALVVEFLNVRLKMKSNPSLVRIQWECSRIYLYVLGLNL